MLVVFYDFSGVCMENVWIIVLFLWEEMVVGVFGWSGVNVFEFVVWVLVYRKESVICWGEWDLVVKLGVGFLINFKKWKWCRRVFD